MDFKLLLIINSKTSKAQSKAYFCFFGPLSFTMTFKNFRTSKARSIFLHLFLGRQQEINDSFQKHYGFFSMLQTIQSTKLELPNTYR